jgi:hypothetical protein
MPTEHLDELKLAKTINGRRKGPKWALLGIRGSGLAAGLHQDRLQAQHRYRRSHQVAVQTIHFALVGWVMVAARPFTSPG